MEQTDVVPPTPLVAQTFTDSPEEAHFRRESTTSSTFNAESRDMLRSMTAGEDDDDESGSDYDDEEEIDFTMEAVVYPQMETVSQVRPQTFIQIQVDQTEHIEDPVDDESHAAQIELPSSIPSSPSSSNGGTFEDTPLSPTIVKSFNKDDTDDESCYDDDDDADTDMKLDDRLSHSASLPTSPHALPDDTRASQVPLPDGPQVQTLPTSTSTASISPTSPAQPPTPPSVTATDLSYSPAMGDFPAVPGSATDWARAVPLPMSPPPLVIQVQDLDHQRAVGIGLPLSPLDHEVASDEGSDDEGDGVPSAFKGLFSSADNKRPHPGPLNLVSLGEPLPNTEAVPETAPISSPLPDSGVSYLAYRADELSPERSLGKRRETYIDAGNSTPGSADSDLRRLMTSLQQIGNDVRTASPFLLLYAESASI